MGNAAQRPERPPTTGRWRGVAFVILVVLLPVIGGVAGYFVATYTPKQYTAHAYVLISNSGADTDVTSSQLAQATARVATGASVLTSGRASSALLAAAADGDLAASSSPDAPLVDLSATAGAPSTAADLANQLAEAVSEHTTGLKATKVTSRIFASAAPPAHPSSPNTLVDVAAGIALGVVLGGVIWVSRRASARSGH
jgi:capsular polysaccharide biosynthesis protein